MCHAFYREIPIAPPTLIFIDGHPERVQVRDKTVLKLCREGRGVLSVSQSKVALVDTFEFAFGRPWSSTKFVPGAQSLTVHRSVLRLAAVYVLDFSDQCTD